MKLLGELDAYGMDDPDNNEGFPEDRCSICEHPIIDHPCWSHRRRALFFTKVLPWLRKL
jgi:hypothetical protein